MISSAIVKRVFVSLDFVAKTAHRDPHSPDTPTPDRFATRSLMWECDHNPYELRPDSFY